MYKNKKSFSKVFLIAGSEPLGSAGIQADIKAISACGGYAAGAITCIVDEDTKRVKDICMISTEMVVGQADSFLSDVGADCIKTGMLYSKDMIVAVAALLKRYTEVPLLVDPVMVASGGAQLIENNAIDAYKKYLFPLALITTPNKREADLLLGREIKVENIEADLKELCQWGNSVIVKSIDEGETLKDFFYDVKTGKMSVFSKKKINTRNINGTGDSFGSAIATYIARGYSLQDAVSKAEQFIHKAIETGAEYSFGEGYGPVHAFYNLPPL